MKEVRNAWENKESLVCHHHLPGRMIFVDFLTEEKKRNASQCLKCIPLLRVWLLMLKTRFAMVQPCNLGSDCWENTEVVRRAEGSLPLLG